MVRNAVSCAFAQANSEQIVYKVTNVSLVSVHTELRSYIHTHTHTGCFLCVYTKQVLLHQDYDYA